MKEKAKLKCAALKCAAEESANIENLEEIEKEFWKALYTGNGQIVHDLITTYDLSHIFQVVEDKYFSDSITGFMCKWMRTLRTAIISKDPQDIDAAIEYLSDNPDLLFNTMLWSGVYSDNRNLVKAIISIAGKGLLNKLYQEVGETILTYAIKSCSAAMVELLLSLGLNVNRINEECEHPLNLALERIGSEQNPKFDPKDSQKILKMVFRQVMFQFTEIGPQSFTGNIYNTYAEAVKANQLKFVDLLLKLFLQKLTEEFLADPEYAPFLTQRKMFLLEHAVLKGAYGDILDFFIKKGGDINRALFIAAASHNLKACEQLIAKGANVNYKALYRGKEMTVQEVVVAISFPAGRLILELLTENGAPPLSNSEEHNEALTQRSILEFLGANGAPPLINFGEHTFLMYPSPLDGSLERNSLTSSSDLPNQEGKEILEGNVSEEASKKDEEKKETKSKKNPLPPEYPVKSLKKHKDGDDEDDEEGGSDGSYGGDNPDSPGDAQEKQTSHYAKEGSESSDATHSSSKYSEESSSSNAELLFNISLKEDKDDIEDYGLDKFKLFDYSRYSETQESTSKESDEKSSGVNSDADTDMLLANGMHHSYYGVAAVAICLPLAYAVTTAIGLDGYSSLSYLNSFAEDLFGNVVENCLDMASL